MYFNYIRYQNSYVYSHNFEQVNLNVCKCTPWGLYDDKQGFAIVQQFAESAVTWAIFLLRNDSCYALCHIVPQWDKHTAGLLSLSFR